MTPNRETRRFVMCVDSGDYPASLEVRKVYLRLPDVKADEAGLYRVIDESGEDYLYPVDLFEPVSLSVVAAKLFDPGH